MPNWKMYDKAAPGLSSGLYSGEEWARDLNAVWLLPGYTFQADIPNWDLTGYTTGGVRTYPTSVDPFFWLPKYPSNYPTVSLRGTVIPQNFVMPGWRTQPELINVDFDSEEERAELIRTHESLFGESHLWYDTENQALRWHCPTVRWVPNTALPPVQHLIFFSSFIGEPFMLLSLDAPIPSNIPYEFDWAGGLYGIEEERYGVVLNIVEG